MRIRLATVADAELLWRWRNDPVTRENSFTTRLICWPEHKAWFSERLQSPDVRFYILEDDGHGAVAEVRYERTVPGQAEVHIAVAPELRGKGYGKQVLLRSLALARSDLQVTRIEAFVKADNVASFKTFLAVGFTVQEQVQRQGSACVRMAVEK